MTRTLYTAALLILALTTTGIRHLRAGCAHHRPVHHVAVVQPVTVLYSVGTELQIEAAVEKALQQRLQAQPLTAPASTLSAKCIRCHTGESAKGSVDFSKAIDADTFRRSLQLIGTGEDAPAAMTGVLKALTPDEKGKLMTELLKLSEPAGVLR